MSFFEKLLSWANLDPVAEKKPEEIRSDLKKNTKKFQLIDVRTPREFNSGHIKGSLNVPLSILGRQMDALPFDKKKPIVVICYSASRSVPAVRSLSKAGFEDATQLAGGLREWEEKGFPTRKG